MIKAPELDWDEIDAARMRARKLHSEAGYKFIVAVGNAVRGIFRMGWKFLTGDRATSKASLVERSINFAKAKSPLERGLQAGWY